MIHRLLTRIMCIPSWARFICVSCLPILLFVQCLNHRTGDCSIQIMVHQENQTKDSLLTLTVYSFHLHLCAYTDRRRWEVGAGVWKSAVWPVRWYSGNQPPGWYNIMFMPCVVPLPSGVQLPKSILSAAPNLYCPLTMFSGTKACGWDRSKHI